MSTLIHGFSSFSAARRAQRQSLFDRRSLLWHLFFWAATLALHLIYWMLSFFAAQGEVDVTVNVWNAIQMFLLALPVAVLFNYTYLLWVVPLVRFTLQRRIVWFYFFLEILLFAVVYFLIADPQNQQIFLSFLFVLLGLQSSFFSFFYFWDIYDKQKVLANYQDVLEQRNEAESRFLNEQVNPHFLFNTLNNIYSLTFQDKKKAKVSIEKMLSMISYIHHESTSAWIDLNTEIDFLKSYLNLELLRYKDDNVRLIFEVDGKLEGVRIAPLILINFVENAFKHGIKAREKKSYINIRIDVYEHQIVFVIRNRKSKAQTSVDAPVGGIGLSNVRRRLELIYQKNYELKIKDRKGIYEVKLTLGKARS